MPVKAEVHYQVQGSWPFPLDMLRYDDARAATPDDQAKIDHLSGEVAPDQSAIRAQTEIWLIGKHRPCTARWESFGWAVPTDREHAMLRAERTKDRKRLALRDSALAKITPEEREALEWFAGNPLAP